MNKSINSLTESVLFFDSKCDLNQNELLEYSLIITFDYNSHKKLQQNNISHIVSDTFLQKEDYELIQTESYRLSRWYEQTEIQKYVVYDDINLGELFYIELHYEIIPILKKTFEIKNIIKNYPNVMYVAPKEYTNILNVLCAEFKTFKTSNTTQITLYDNVVYSLNFGRRFFTISIKRSNFNRIRKITENILTKFLYRKTDNDFCLLFSEFNTLKYKDLFTSTNSKKILPICRRRPLIWNLKTFLIIRNSYCIIPKISDKRKLIEADLSSQKIKNLEESEEFFNTFFQIQNLPFWQIIKEFFFHLCEKRIHQSLDEILFMTSIFEKYRIRSIALLSESGFYEKIIIYLSKKFNIPTCLLQHGISEINKKHLDSFAFRGNISNKTDKLFTWGHPLKDLAILGGLSENKVSMLGSPAHEQFFKENEKNIKNKFILLTIKSPSQFFAKNLSVEMNEKFETTIIEICKLVNNLNKKLIIKLHPSDQTLKLPDAINRILPSVKILKNTDIIDLIKECEILISLDGSTTIYEALILKKPVVLLPISEDDSDYDSLRKYDACVFSDLLNLENHLRIILSDQNFKTSLINNGQKFISHCFVNQTSASNEIIKFMSEM